VATSTGKMQE